jgi:hypothetical protein
MASCVLRNASTFWMGNTALVKSRVPVPSPGDPSTETIQHLHQPISSQPFEPKVEIISPPKQVQEGEEEDEEDDEEKSQISSIPRFKKGISMKSKKLSGLGSTSAGGGGTDVDDEDGEDAIDILFQLIPYHGQSQSDAVSASDHHSSITSNEAIFHSALSAAPVEEIDRRDSFGNTLLLCSCQYALESVVRILLNKGADPNATNSAGVSCLHFSCYKDSLSSLITQLLLQNGANPDVQELTYGCTPLHYAASSGEGELCRILISYGAEARTLDYYEYAPGDYAREGGYEELAAYLQMTGVGGMMTSTTTTLSQSQRPDQGGTSASTASASVAAISRSNQSNVDLLSSALHGDPSALSPSSSTLSSKPFLTHQSSSSIITPLIDLHQHHLLPEPSPRHESGRYPPPLPSPPRGSPQEEEESWAIQVDQATSERYFLNMATGECLWEADYHRRCQEREEKTRQRAVENLAFPTPLKTLTRGESTSKLPGTSPGLSSAKSSFRLNPFGALSKDHPPHERVSETVLQEEIILLKKKIQEIQLLSEQTLEKHQTEFRQQLMAKDLVIVQIEVNSQTILRENERLEVCL